MSGVVPSNGTTQTPGRKSCRTKAYAIVLVLFGSVAAGMGRAPAEEVDQRPNLVAIPPYDVQVSPADDWKAFDQKVALRFTTAVANRAPYAFDIVGTTSVSVEQPTLDALQCTKWGDAQTHAIVGTCLGRTSIGTIIYHSQHQHWHLERFVAYELRRLDESGEIDWRDEGLMGESKKVSFCIIDVEQDSEPPPPGSPEYGGGMYQACATSAMGLSPGSRDVYEWNLFDQQIPLTGVPDGSYALVSLVNPEGRFIETTASDNIAFTLVRIAGEDVELI